MKGNHKHDMSRTPTWKTWMSMRMRCEKPYSTVWEFYGGRGIKVCERWSEFANFYADMGERPQGTSIDRIDNDGNYEPGNCRWATAHEQFNNRRSTRIIELADGRRMSISDAAREYGVPMKTVWKRINEYKWDVMKALTTTPKAGRPRNERP